MAADGVPTEDAERQRVTCGSGGFWHKEVEALERREHPRGETILIYLRKGLCLGISQHRCPN